MAIENFKRIIDSAVNADIFDQEDSFGEEEEKFHLRGSDGVESSGSGTCSSAYSNGCSDIGGKCGAKTGCYDDGPQRGACRGFTSWKCTCQGEGGDCSDDMPKVGDNKNCCATNANGDPLSCIQIHSETYTCCTDPGIDTCQ